MADLHVPDSPKMLRETLCVAQTHVGLSGLPQAAQHVARLQRLIDDIDRQRPLSPDGKHGDRHTLTCGCEGTAAGYADDDLRREIVLRELNQGALAGFGSTVTEKGADLILAALGRYDAWKARGGDGRE